ncbi:MAG: 3-isopropylmalate dehydratase small subunit [Gammaproteobacteria bacterium]|nr:3-isopropylmalate dehydratase small subunit [Gammaproteobacteria bacterium]MDH3506075.1 3-isopropylmalate dehydratase small subunit [Gammaproteobacteria bacterium]
MEPIKSITSKTVVIPLDDIDTDQIIPARFLTTTTREGLGEHLFTDWRYTKDGTPNPDFVLNAPEAQDAQILVAGRNFGCGSSREHAPWALLDFGLRVAISTEIADIFFNNALKNGFIPVVVDADTHAWLLENPGVEITVDLESSTVIVPGRDPVPFSVDSFAKYCLLNGLDQMGFLTQHADDIAAFEARAE